MLQVAASASLIVIGLVVALVMDTESDMKIVAWVIVGMGVLGIVLRQVMVVLKQRWERPSR